MLDEDRERKKNIGKIITIKKKRKLVHKRY